MWNSLLYYWKNQVKWWKFCNADGNSSLEKQTFDWANNFTSINVYENETVMPISSTAAIYFNETEDKAAFSLPKTTEFSFILSNVVVNIIRVRINAIRFIFFETDVRTFEIRINAWRKRNQNRWHFFLRFSADCIVHFISTTIRSLQGRSRVAPKRPIALSSFL